MITRLMAPLGRVQAWLWTGALLALVLLWLAEVSHPRVIPGATQIHQAEVERQTPVQVPPRSVALPHVWDDEVPPWSGQAVYRIAWPPGLSVHSEALAMYLPRVGARFRVRLNDKIVTSGAWDVPGYADTSVVPHLVDLPTELLNPRSEDNVLSIEVQGLPLRKSGLSDFVLGPRAALEERFQRVTWWQVQVTWMVAACSLFLALLSVSMWLQNRERAFVLLAVASLAWALRLGLTPLVHPHMPFAVWFYLHKLSFTVYCGFLYLFMWDLFEYRQGRIRSLVVWLLWVGPVWLLVTTWSGQYDLYRVWTGMLAVVSLVALTLMFSQARWREDKNERLMVVVGAVILVTGVRDFLVVQLGWPGDGDLRWMTPGSLVLILTMASAQVQRTSRYIQQIGQLNRDLELRVRQREGELRQAFDQIRDAERRQVLDNERKRLTRDMHDGLGSQLVQTLNMVRSTGQADPVVISSMLTHALEDLRLTLDSLEPLEGDLPAILGMLRRRIAPALEASGIELDWQVEEVFPIEGLESRGVMNLFRCLQEVFANIIKHAGASRVLVRTWLEDGRTMLSVTDNGKGLGAGYREGGRGLHHIRLRAAEIGATVRFDDAQPGTRVQFRFALPGGIAP